MAYLGNAPARSFISFERQVFTIVNSQTAYTLSHSVNNENDIRLVVNNIVQEPGSGKAYTASGTTLTLSAALTNGTDEMYCVFLGRATATNAPGAGSVGTSQLASDAVTEAKIADAAVESEHLNNNVISGQTALGATPADTDELLVSDAGTIKRVDYSYLKVANTPAFFAKKNSNTDISNNTWTVVDFETEVIDTNSAYDTSNFRFTVPSGEAGKYFIFNTIQAASNSTRVIIEVLSRIRKNGTEQTYAHGSYYNTATAHQLDLSNYCILDLSAADYLDVQGYINVSSGTPKFAGNSSTLRSFFGGYKLIGV